MCFENGCEFIYTGIRKYWSDIYMQVSNKCNLMTMLREIADSLESRICSAVSMKDNSFISYE